MAQDPSPMFDSYIDRQKTFCNVLHIMLKDEI